MPTRTKDNGPEGLGRGFKDLLRVLPFNEAGRGALHRPYRRQDTAQTFLIGARRDVLAPVSGRLSVGINQTTSDTGDGNYAVRIEIYTPEGGSTRVATRQVASLPGIDNQLFSKIPRRISDKDGNPGDMVNFLILGSETAMQRVFGHRRLGESRRRRERHRASRRSRQSFERILSDHAHEPALPLWRPQDYGWAHAEPISVVRSRNHLRIWKAPFQVKGETLWVGAATHDIGSNATNAITASPTRSIRTSISSATTSKKRSRLPAL